MCSISIPLCAQSYERSKAIKGIKEAKYWSDISADMMSEEEKVDDQYVRHPPLYRSERLNKFVDKLDHSLSKYCLSDRPRITHVLGSPHKALPPINAKKWTVNHAWTSSRRIFDTLDAVCHGYSRINDEDQEEEDEQLPGMSSDSEFSAGDSE